MDAETKGDYIKHLIKEVGHAEFTEDAATSVIWLDDELSYLVSLYLSFFFITVPNSPYVYCC